MPDLANLIRSDFDTYSGDLRALGERMREQGNILGPRQRKRLREHVMDLPVDQSLPLLRQLYDVAGHKEGEPVPCAACRFLEGG